MKLLFQCWLVRDIIYTKNLCGCSQTKHTQVLTQAPWLRTHIRMLDIAVSYSMFKDLSCKCACLLVIGLHLWLHIPVSKQKVTSFKTS